MCGITGFIQINSNLKAEEMDSIIHQMANTLYHRGPDSSGIWIDAEAGIALGHRRLSIIDLSSGGHQPMTSITGRYIMVFNGEIYNYKEIRQELLKTSELYFRGNSDTEVMLAAIERWGIEKSVKKCVGMFAFALWDNKEKQLHLVRDRIGEKPLYYAWMGDVFLFGSELKALKVHPQFKGNINRDALALYMRYSYIPAPYSIYENIFKVEPGTIFTLDGGGKYRKEGKLTTFWSAKEQIEKRNIFTGNEEEAVQELNNMLSDTVKKQMVAADVPVGAFLSGGIDSSTIVALMQAQSERPVRTFSIGFYESRYNEAVYAKRVANYLGTEHTELYVTPQQAMSVIPKLPSLYDEPFADPSQIPTYLVAQLARQHVTVSLSGDGGDELFGGYSRYFFSQSIWDKISRVPKPIISLFCASLKGIPTNIWDISFKFLPTNWRQKISGDRVHKAADILSVNNEKELYHQLISYWKNSSSVVLHSKENETFLSQPERWAELDFFQWMMYIDMLTYLPDDILVKVDRASMGVHLESRIPLLDHRVIEFIWSLPHSMKVKSNQGKWILRQLLYKYVPAHLIERPKMGFGVPLDEWLRGSLQEWGEDLLNETRLKEEGFFQPAIIRQKWVEHLTGKRNWSSYLWIVLMFQAWLEQEQKTYKSKDLSHMLGKVSK